MSVDNNRWRHITGMLAFSNRPAMVATTAPVLMPVKLTTLFLGMTLLINALQVR